MKAFPVRLLGLVLGFLPGAYIAGLFFTSNLGVNPVEKLTHETGLWALILLLASLSITPTAKIFKLKPLFYWRKYFGLYAFIYAFCHFMIYLFLDLSLDFQFLYDDIIDRPYITVGFLALVLLIPLAVTSTQTARRKLGRNWLTLHKLVYVIGALALLHYYWRIRADYFEWYFYAGIFAVLMLWRMRKYFPNT